MLRSYKADSVMAIPTFEDVPSNVYAALTPATAHFSATPATLSPLQNTIARMTGDITVPAGGILTISGLSETANTVKIFLNGDLYKPGTAIPGAGIYKVDFRCDSLYQHCFFFQNKILYFLDSMIQIDFLDSENNYFVG